MAGRLDVTVQSVRDFSRDLRDYATALDGSTSKMVSRLTNLGQDWRDDKYRDFKGEMDDLTTRIKKARVAAETYAKYLDRYAAKLDEADRSRIRM
jgi:uncharacterized protein YukE